MALWREGLSRGRRPGRDEGSTGVGLRSRGVEPRARLKPPSRIYTVEGQPCD